MTRPDQGDSWWRAVLDEPDAVAPRAAFARHVGGDRCAFMLAQLEQSERMRAGRTWHEPALRADKLLAGNERAWGGPIVDDVPAARFLRGCVEWIAVDATYFVRAWRELYALAPIRHLDVIAAADVADALFDCEGLERIAGLSFNLFGTPHYRPLGDAAAYALAASPRLRRLRYLDVQHCGLSEAALVALAASPNLPRLEVGLLGGNAVADLGEEIGQDWDGTVTDIRPSAGLFAFEQRHGERAWLHACERAGRRVLREEI